MIMFVSSIANHAAKHRARFPCRTTTAAAAVSTQPQAHRVKSSVFSFKHFHLNHGRCAQKMGTDAMILGAWAQPPPNTTKVLDVGTGTGVLALMMAQKTQQQGSMIHAIDIEHDAYVQASENALLCPWSDRLLIAHQSFQDWVQSSNHKYDMVITNPPYFLQSNKPNVSARAAARHADVLLPFCELAAGAAQVLQPNGRLCLILPVLEAQHFVAEAAQHGLLLTRLLRVYTKCQDPEPKRHLMQFELVSSPTAREQRLAVAASGAAAACHALNEQLVVMQQRVDPVTQQVVHKVYSEQYQQLTADFHHPTLLQRGS